MDIELKKLYRDILKYRPNNKYKKCVCGACKRKEKKKIYPIVGRIKNGGGGAYIYDLKVNGKHNG